MAIHFVADVHVGNHRRFGGGLISGVNLRAAETLDVLKEAVRIANKSGDTLVVLGDLCDTPRPTPQLLRAIGNALTPDASMSGPIVLLVGNHDRVSMAENDHALAPLDWIEGVRVVEKPSVMSVEASSIMNEQHLVLVPHNPAPAKEWLAQTVAELDPPKGGLLCIHLGVEDENTPWFLQGAADSIHVDILRELIDDHELAGVFAGNWHDRRVWEGPNGEPIVQVGALVPTGFDNPGLEGYGSVAHWHDSNQPTLAGRMSVPSSGVDFTEIEGPRFVTCKTVDALEKVLAASTTETEGVVVPPFNPRIGDVPSWVRAKYVTQSPTLLEGEAEVEHLRDSFYELVVEVAAQNMEAAATNAAEGVKQGKCFDEVLAEYVENMDLGELAPEVLATVRGYLNESKTN